MAVMSMAAVLKMHADADPDRPMITCEGHSISRRDFDLSTNRLARAYQALGVGEDDLVTIALPNGIEFYQAAVATWKLGATPQPVSAKLPDAELQAIVELAKPALIVGTARAVVGGRAHVAEGFVPAPDLSPEISDAPLPDRITRHWKAPTSGGSTGRPKLIVAKSPAAFDPDAPFMGMTLGQTQLVPGPLYHNAPFSLSMIGLSRGHHLVVMKRFDPQEALALIEEHRVGWVLMVPTMMSRISRLAPEVRARFDVSSIETLWHMAAPCPAWLKQAWIDWLGPEKIWELYGGTEAQGTTLIRGDEWLAHKGSVGKPLDLFDMKILGENGQVLPAGEIGEIYMRPKAGAGTTYHYVGAEARATNDGFESLGDLGWFDADGYLYIADRRTDMILCGGANVYPAEVEAAIDAHPNVRSSAVIGLPDDDLGNRVHAIVDCFAPMDAEELIAFVGTQVARYKVPRSVEFVTEPVRDDAGKVRRSELRRVRLEAGVVG
ncbi:AMP-binding protein [Sphingomonas sp.]|uniref:AMP-binding protein n=1 Tax=Sphingomonas sp. TaxID=28214 RepID=UPI0035A8E862